ncbi:MAG TPA: phosphoribosyltransferase family protein [Coriobacteriia bacterium]|nr:phosphoribosyltransferase family protein [Coriobacteriia bacterium]
MAANVRVLQRVELPTPAFSDRSDAGRALALVVAPEPDPDAFVLALPRGGVPVGQRIAAALGCRMQLVPVRKLPIPTSPEMGFGALTLDGTVTLNHAVMDRFGVTFGQAALVIEDVRRELERRAATYPGGGVLPDLAGGQVVLVDDGLATGYTMLATCEMVRRSDPSRLVVAVPVAPTHTLELIAEHCDELVCLIAQEGLQGFAVASFYERFPDLTDAEVIDAFSSDPQGVR